MKSREWTVLLWIIAIVASVIRMVVHLIAFHAGNRNVVHVLYCPVSFLLAQIRNSIRSAERNDFCAGPRRRHLRQVDCILLARYCYAHCVFGGCGFSALVRGRDPRSPV